MNSLLLRPTYGYIFSNIAKHATASANTCVHLQVTYTLCYTNSLSHRPHAKVCVHRSNVYDIRSHELAVKVVFSLQRKILWHSSHYLLHKGTIRYTRRTYHRLDRLNFATSVQIRLSFRGIYRLTQQVTGDVQPYRKIYSRYRKIATTVANLEICLLSFVARTIKSASIFYGTHLQYSPLFRTSALIKVNLNTIWSAQSTTAIFNPKPNLTSHSSLVPGGCTSAQSVSTLAVTNKKHSASQPSYLSWLTLYGMANSEDTNEDELLKSDNEKETDISDHLKKLKFRPLPPYVSATLPQSKNPTKVADTTPRTPKRKIQSPNTDQEAKKRILNAMVPPKTSEVVQKMLQIVDIVIDAEENTPVTKDQGDLIDEELTKVLFASDKLSILDFEHCGYERGLFRTICKNDETREWVISTAPTLTFAEWPNAKLKTVVAGKPPKLVRASIVLKLPTPEHGSIFEVIGARNPTIDTKFWRLYGKDKADRGKQLWSIGIDEKSAEIIKGMDYHVQYGLNKLRISVHENKNYKRRN